MTRRRRNILPFKRRSKWRKRKDGRGYVRRPTSRLARLGRIPVFGWLIMGAFTLGVVPPVIDAAKGFATPTEGCKVWQVTDGDTVKIACRDGTHRARIIGYDAPELFSPECTREWWLAIKATAYLRWQLWTAGHVTVRRDGTDRYGRPLIVLLTNGEGVARRMVEAGLGRWYDGGRRAGWCA